MLITATTSTTTNNAVAAGKAELSLVSGKVDGAVWGSETPGGQTDAWDAAAVVGDGACVSV